MIRLSSLLAAAALSLSAAVSAHVTVLPKESAAAAHERYFVRVPNEKDVDTVSLEVRFPAALRVTAVEQKSGWLAEPIRDASGKLVGVRWQGHLPPQEFTEFGLLAVNPAAPGALRWTAVQSFADGTRVEWAGPAGSKVPGPVVTIK
jgi:Domain of unkown function (DUF1775)